MGPLREPGVVSLGSVIPTTSMASGQQPSMHPSSSSRRPQPPQAASQAAPDRPAPLPLKLEVFTRGTVIPAPLSEQQQEQVLQRRLKKHGAPTSAELGTRTTNATTALSSLPVAPENPMLSAVSDDTPETQEKGRVATFEFSQLDC